MENKLTFITASAGTGKTYHLVEKVIEKVRNQEIEPEKLIATTFTTEAAREMKERLSAGFHKESLHEAANRMESDALISTVHGICFRLLSRFAFEAGISPDLRVIDENEARHLLDQSIDDVIDESDRQEIYLLAARLGQRQAYTWAWNWRNDIRSIVEKARSNDITPSSLSNMAKASWKEMKDCLGSRLNPNLNDSLLQQIDTFFEESANSTVGKTITYRELLTEFKNRLGTPDFAWSNWEKLTNEKNYPEAGLKDFADDIAYLAEQVGSHPDLHNDLERYVFLLFDFAERAGDRFAELKRNKGAADFADLEKLTLVLLQSQPLVGEILSEEIDLLLVDEFQDTSPIQLALFAALGEFAKEIIWVGDVKQSIYGFRGSDPSLVFAAASQAKQGNPLSKSWRSVPELVEFINQIIGPAFSTRLNLDPSEIQVAAHRDTPPEAPPAIEIAKISTGQFNKGNKQPKKLSTSQKSKIIAETVSRFLDRTDEKATIKGSIDSKETIGKSRPVEAGDVAILVRRRAPAIAIANELRAKGFEVNLTGHGLLITPEATLALACLRRWIDSTDSLAAAEIISLTSNIPVEDWLDNRLEYIHHLGDTREFESPLDF